MLDESLIRRDLFYSIAYIQIMKHPKSVDEYIASTPKEMRARLRELRRAIKAAAPKAEERISYGMPYYDYKGRLAYFRLAKRHIGLYIPPPVVDEHKKELTAYKAHRATIQLPLDKNLPIALIKKLVKARARKNDASCPKVIPKKDEGSTSARCAVEPYGPLTGMSR